MKKIKKLISFVVIFISLFFMIGCFNNQTTVTTSENYLMDFEFMDNYMYDFESGLMIENINYAISSKECTYSDEVVLNNYHNVSYIFFWTQNNQFIGYYATEGSIITYDKYIMTYSSNNLVLPNNTFRMAFMVNKNGIDGYYRLGLETYLDDSFEVIMSYDKTSYVFQSIDDYVDVVEGYEDLTYRDIFGDSLFGVGKTNIIDNGDFEGINDYLSFGKKAGCVVDSPSGELLFNPNGVSNQPYLTFSYSMVEGHIYYSSLKYYHNDLVYFADSPINTISLYNGSQLEIESIETLIKTKTSILFEMNVSYGSMVLYIKNVWSSSSALTYIDDYMLYDLTTIFSGYTLPSEEQFTLMLEEYQRLEDYMVTIGNINTSAFKSIKNSMSDSVLWGLEIEMMDLIMITNYEFNNLISNGDFSIDSNSDGLADGFSAWNGNTFLNDGVQNVAWNNVSTYYGISRLETFIVSGFNMYLYFEISATNVLSVKWYDSVAAAQSIGSVFIGVYSFNFIPYDDITRIGLIDYATSVNDELDLDNIMLFNNSVGVIDLTQIQMDEMMDLFIYVDNIDFPYIQDQDFNVYYTYYDTDNSNNPIDDYDRVVVFPRWDIYESYLLSMNSDLTTTEIYQIIFDTSFYNNEYNSTTLLSYGDYVDTELFLVSPALYYNLFDYEDKYSLDLQESYRDNVMDLFWSYKNGEERFEFFVDYDITEDNFDGFYSEYLRQLEEITKVSYANLSTMVVSGTMVYSIHEYEISEVLDNFILSIGIDIDFVFVLVSILIFVLSIVVLAVKSAPRNIIILSIMVELLLFVILGWIDKWIILVLALMLFLMVLMVILKKRG